MKIENTIYSNYQLVVDDCNIPVAVRINDEVKFVLYDTVEVTADSHGFICSEITHEGMGIIVQIRRDTTDHFFGVLMEDGEFGFLKDSRIELVYRE